MLSKFEFDALLDWFAKNGRHDLVWRNFNTLDEKNLAYRIWLSEILLQQTQAERVVSYYNKILDKYPTIEQLASATYDEFFPYYQGLGYYSRAHNLLACAKKVVLIYDGIFPKESKALQSLPGIGPYTAEAIRSFAYKIPTMSFDTNLEKIFARYYYGSRFKKLSQDEKGEIIEQLKKGHWSSDEINAALMDLASIWSKNSKSLIDYSASPFRHCLFTNTRGDKELEPPRKVQYFPTKDARIIVILHANHKEYFSLDHQSYTPYILQASELDSRKAVQEYFRETFQLELSVRPPHKKMYIENIPHVLVNAQIQTGTHSFTRFSKQDVSSYMTTIVHTDD